MLLLSSTFLAIATKNWKQTWTNKTASFKAQQKNVIHTFVGRVSTSVPKMLDKDELFYEVSNESGSNIK